MNQYDSVLKENNNKVVVEKEEIRKFPKFLVSFLLIFIVIVVSYIIYFNKVLSSKNVLGISFNEVLDKYSEIFKNIPYNEFKIENNLVGLVNYKGDITDFNLVKNGNNMNFNISDKDRFINYYLVNNSSYVKLPNINKNILISPSFTINDLMLVKDNLNNIDDDKFNKTIYFSEKRPIVVVDIVLDTKALNSIFGFNIKENYEVIATFKRNAIMNTLEEIKVIINNKTTLDRRVITVYDDYILYSIGDDDYKLVYEDNGDDFILKVSKNDTLYSVLSGSSTMDKYVYTYQVINKKYNVNVVTYRGEDGSYYYDVLKKKDDIEESVNINIKISDSYVIDDKVTNFVDSSKELLNQAYENELKYFKDKFLYFSD